MITTMFRVLACGIVAMLATAAIACGGDDDDSDNDDNGATPAAGVASPAADADDDDDAAAGAGGGGTATLTVGGQSWTFDNFYCRRSPDETGNARTSFSSGSIGAPDGVRLQLDASIQDTTEAGRYEGDGVIHSVTLNDIEDFENSSVAWAAVSGLVGGGESFIAVDGNSVTAETTFDDERTDEIEQVPGTLEATCG